MDALRDSGRRKTFEPRDSRRGSNCQLEVRRSIGKGFLGLPRLAGKGGNLGEEVGGHRGRGF